MNKKSKRNLTIRIILEIIVIVVLAARALRGEFYTVFLCGLTLCLFNIPLFVDRKLNIKLPGTLEVIILLFIFSAEILGEIGSFYTYIPWWDTMLHTINGFIMAAIGFSLIDILNNQPKFHIKMSPFFVALVAFCVSMTVGVLWEFFEFTMDCFMETDMQKDFLVKGISSVALNPEGVNSPVKITDITETLIKYTENGVEKQYIIQNGYLDIGIYDTIKDLIVNCIGALVFSAIGYFYIVGRNKGVFARRFIPLMKTPEEIEEDNAEQQQKKRILKSEDKEFKRK